MKILNHQIAFTFAIICALFISGCSSGKRYAFRQTIRVDRTTASVEKQIPEATEEPVETDCEAQEERITWEAEISKADQNQYAALCIQTSTLPDTRVMKAAPPSVRMDKMISGHIANPEQIKNHSAPLSKTDAPPVSEAKARAFRIAGIAALAVCLVSAIILALLLSSLDFYVAGTLATVAISSGIMAAVFGVREMVKTGRGMQSGRGTAGYICFFGALAILTAWLAWFYTMLGPSLFSGNY